MGLTFPNSSRSYDDTLKRVRFLGHDGMFEVRFFVEAGALGKAISRAATEADYLAAFDSLRSTILDVAKKAYARTRRDSYILTEADF